MVDVDPAVFNERFFAPQWGDSEIGRSDIMAHLPAVLQSIAPPPTADALLEYWFTHDARVVTPSTSMACIAQRAWCEEAGRSVLRGFATSREHRRRKTAAPRRHAGECRSSACRKMAGAALDGCDGSGIAAYALSLTRMKSRRRGRATASRPPSASPRSGPGRHASTGPMATRAPWVVRLRAPHSPPDAASTPIPWPLLPRQRPARWAPSNRDTPTQSAPSQREHYASIHHAVRADGLFGLSPILLHHQCWPRTFSRGWSEPENCSARETWVCDSVEAIHAVDTALCRVASPSRPRHSNAARLPTMSPSPARWATPNAEALGT